jgi:hypothetical protein
VVAVAELFETFMVGVPVREKLVAELDQTDPEPINVMLPAPNAIARTFEVLVLNVAVVCVNPLRSKVPFVKVVDLADPNVSES